MQDQYPTLNNLDGLALEYERDYGTASGNLSISDLVNNPAANGICRVFGLSPTKQLGDLIPRSGSNALP
jgi:hypothetical protein